MPGGLRVALLGPLAVSIDGRPLALSTGQLRKLLAALAVSAGRVVPVDRLATAIWTDERFPDRPEASIRIYVSRLRTLLGAGTIASSRAGYTLNLPPDHVDLLRFTRVLESAAGAGDPAEEYELLTEAVALWRGNPFEDIGSAWLDRSQAPQLVERYLAAVERRVDLDLAAGRVDGLVAELRRLAAEHRLRESLWVRLLTVLDRSGRPAEALEQYEAIRVRLADELGTDPGPALQRLYRELLTGGSRPVPPAGTAGSVVPRQIPPDIDGFVGRGTALRRLDELVGEAGPAPDRAVVVAAISGTAGIGKTALAVHFAHQVADRFPDGQLYLNLRGFAPTGRPVEPAEAVRGFLDSLGVPPPRIPIQLDAQVGLYRSLLAGKRVLVLLDNSRDPEQIRPLLPGSPGCLVLVTSRNQLGGLVARDGATRLDLDALSAAEARDLLVRVLGPGRVAAEPAATAELAALCDHLPLALRIAAANLIAHPHASIGDYLARLREDRLSALEIAGDPTAGVRSAIDHSYASLSGPAQRLFRLLGLVPGPDVTIGAAAALAGVAPQRAAALLSELAAAHLVEEHRNRRYAAHDLLRAYAAGRAGTQEAGADRDTALRELYGYYLRGTDAAIGRLYPEILRLPMPPELADGPAVRVDDEAAALSWLDSERANLAAAVTGALPAVRPLAWRLADALRGYLLMHRHLPEWGEVARAGLAAARADGDLPGMAAARLSLAGYHVLSADHPRAMTEYTEAIALTRQAGWDQGEATAHGNLGLLHWESGRLRTAAGHIEAALAVDERTGWLAAQVVKLSNLGGLSKSLGQLARSAELLTEALERSQKVGSGGLAAAVHSNLGATYHELGRLDEAQRHLTDALRLLRERRERHSEVETLRALAGVRHDLGQSTDALVLAESALALAREAGNVFGETSTLVTAAGIRAGRGDHATADGELRRALAVSRENGYHYLEAKALIGLATTGLHTGQSGAAGDAAAAALAIARRDEYRLLEGDALTALATIDHQAGRLAEAIAHAEQAIAVHTGTGRRLGEAQARLVAAGALRAAGRTGQAAEQQRCAERILAETGARRELTHNTGLDTNPGLDTGHSY